MLPKNVYMSLSPAEKQKVKRKLAKKVSGSGAYIFGKNQPFGHYGEKIGKALSNYIPFGRQLGAYGGHAIGKMFGSGAYISSRGKYIPSYRGTHKMIRGSGAYYDAPKNVSTNATSPPSFGSNRTVIKHREFIGNIIGSTAFTLNSFNVNPGDEATFPWLSAIAGNYEKYRPIGIIFEFKSTSASALNSTNTALGTVMMAPRYNAVSQTAPTSKMEMLQIENCASVCPAESAMCGVECAKNYNPLGVLYNRTGGTIPAGSEQLYDFCDFYLATEGMQATATIGELWVTYEIELLTPILGGGQVGYNINYAHYFATAGVTSGVIMGTNASPVASTNFFLTFAGTSVRFPANIQTGNYQLTYYVIGASTAVVPCNVSASTNCVLVNTFNSGTIANANQGPVTSTRIVQTVTISITGPEAVVIFSGSTMPTSITWADMVVCQLPDNSG